MREAKMTPETPLTDEQIAELRTRCQSFSFDENCAALDRALLELQARRAAEKRIYAAATRELAEPAGDTACLVEICTEIEMLIEPASAGKEGKKESSEMTRMKWECDTCGKKGTIEHDHHAGVYSVVNQLRSAHDAASPECETGVSRLRCEVEADFV